MNQSHKTFDQKLKTSPPQFPAPDVFEAKCHRVRGKGEFEPEMNPKTKLWPQPPRPLIRCLTISSWSHLKRCELLRSPGTSTILKAAWMPSCRWEKETLPSFFVEKDKTMLEVFGSHLKVPPPGDGLWGEGWVERGGEEGDHLHHRPGASDCKTHLMLILWFLVKLHVLSFQSFHSAGDGKLGGLTLPNDGRCHLNTTGFYDWSTVQVVLHLGTNKPAQKVCIRHCAGLPQPGPHQLRGKGAQCEPGLGGDRGAPQPLQEAHTGHHRHHHHQQQQHHMELTQMISTSVAGQISSDSSNVVELVTALISKQDNMWIDIQWQGESDVPEDHDKHQDWGQLDVFRLCSLHQRLQRQKDWKEKVNLSRFS